MRFDHFKRWMYWRLFIIKRGNWAKYVRFFHLNGNFSINAWFFWLHNLRWSHIDNRLETGCLMLAISNHIRICNLQFQFGLFLCSFNILIIQNIILILIDYGQRNFIIGLMFTWLIDSFLRFLRYRFIIH